MWCKYCQTSFEGTGSMCPDCLTIKDGLLEYEASKGTKAKKVPAAFKNKKKTK